MDNKPKTNNPLSNPDTQQLFKGLLVGVTGLVIVLLILLGTATFLVFYDGPSGDDTAIDAESSIASNPNSDALSGEVVDGKDVATGFVVDEGFEIVKATCTGCHSSAIVLQNRFTREGWKEKIVWMQQTQGLWELGDNESIILDYLAKHHAPEPPTGRRLPLKDIEWYELED